jgi:hypothetical protein
MFTTENSKFSDRSTGAKNQNGLEKLSHEIALQVPINVWCIFQSFVIAWQAIRAMTDLFGGTTISLKPGTYKAEKGVILDLSIWIASSTSDAQFDRDQVNMIDLALQVRRTLKQDCVCLKVDGVLEFH